MFTVMIVLALAAVVIALGLGLLSMGVGGSTDKTFGEKFMWARIYLQGIAIILLLAGLYMSNTAAT